MRWWCPEGGGRGGQQRAIIWVTHLGTPTFGLFLEKKKNHHHPIHSGQILGLPPAQRHPSEARPAPRTWPPCGLQPGAGVELGGHRATAGHNCRPAGLVFRFCFVLFSSCSTASLPLAGGESIKGIEATSKMELGFCLLLCLRMGTWRHLKTHGAARGLSITPPALREPRCCEQGEYPGGRRWSGDESQEPHWGPKWKGLRDTGVRSGRPV